MPISVLVPRINLAVSLDQNLSVLETPRLFPTPSISVSHCPPAPLISKGPIVDFVLLMLVSQMDSVQLLRTDWEETAAEVEVRASVVAQAEAVKCMSATVLLRLRRWIP